VNERQRAFAHYLCNGYGIMISGFVLLAKTAGNRK